MNKVVNVNFIGGIIGLLGNSPQTILNNAIKKENEDGWEVVQIIPSESGNLFLVFVRFLILIITLFFYTQTNGYYIIMKKNVSIKKLQSDTNTGLLTNNDEQSLSSQNEHHQNVPPIVIGEQRTKEEIIRNILNTANVNETILNDLTIPKLLKVEKLLEVQANDEKIVFHDNTIKVINKERWQGIVESGNADKFKIIFEKQLI